jgi:hypothetical protein
MAKKISKRTYNELKEIISGEYEAISRMATSMISRLEELEEANPENFETLMIHDRCMRAAFHALAKGYVYQVNPRYYGSYGQQAIKEALDNVGRTIEEVEREGYRYRQTNYKI